MKHIPKLECAVYNIYIELKDKIPDEGLTRKEFQTLYYNIFHRTVGNKRLEEITSLLETVGLLTEEPDPNDKRQKKFLLTPRGVYISNANSQPSDNAEKINTPEGVSNSLSFDALNLRDGPHQLVGEMCHTGPCYRCKQTTQISWYFNDFRGEKHELCTECGWDTSKELEKRLGDVSR